MNYIDFQKNENHILSLQSKLIKTDFIFIYYINNITISVNEFAQYNLMKIILLKIFYIFKGSM